MARQLLRGNADPGIPDRDLDPARGRPRAHPDPAALRRVLGRVVQEVRQHLGQPDGVAGEPHRRPRQLHAQRLPAARDLRLRGLDGGGHHGLELDGLGLEHQLVPADPGEVEQIVSNPREVLGLPRYHLHGGGVSRGVHFLQEMGRVADRGQRVAQLVANHGHEFVLTVIRFLGGLEGVPELPPRRRELRERPDNPLVLPVELPGIGVAHDPHRAHRPAANLEWDEQGLDEPRLRAQGREKTVRQVHELGHVLIDAHTAWAGRPGHRAVAVRGEHPCHGFPSKHVPFEQAEAGRVGPAELQRRLDEPLEHGAGVLGHLLGQGRQRPVQAIWLG